MFSITTYIYAVIYQISFHYKNLTEEFMNGSITWPWRLLQAIQILTQNTYYMCLFTSLEILRLFQIHFFI